MIMTRYLMQMLVELPTALDVLLKASVVLSLGWGLHLALALSNPRWRVLLWRAVAVGLLLAPLLGSFMPALRLTVPREPVAATVSPAPASPEMLMKSEPAPVVAAPAITPRTPQPKEAPRQSAFGLLRQFPWLSLGLLWSGGCALLAIKLLVSLRGVSRRLLSSAPVEGPLHNLLGDLREEIGITRPVGLRVSGELSSPFLYGFRRPVIILPERMTHGDYVNELPAIFAHELAHLKGRDLTWITLLHLLSIAFWFHPLAWRLREVHAVACEAVCDGVAARHVGSSLAYSRTLARIALELVALPPTVGGIAMARMSQVRRRLEILKRNIYFRPLLRRWVIVALSLGFSILSAIAGVRFVAAETPVTPKAKIAPAVAESLRVEATILLPDGKPAAGAEVHVLNPWFQHIIYTDGQYVEPKPYITGEGEKFYPSPKDRLTADSAGEISFMASGNLSEILVFHEQGYAHVILDAMVKSHEIRLEPGGRVEGKAFCGKEPLGNQNLELSVFMDKLMPCKEHGPLWPMLSDNIQLEINTLTDDKGGFAVNFLPPGIYSAIHRKDFRGHPLLPVVMCLDVLPGRTTKVHVGGKGRPIQGRIVKAGRGWIHMDDLIQPIGGGNIFSVKKEPLIPEHLKMAEEMNAYHDNWRKSPEGKSAILSSTQNPLFIDPDWTFHAEDIPPGKYRMEILATKRQAGKTQRQSDTFRLGYEFEVPEFPDDVSEVPLDLGEIKVTIKKR